MAERPPAASQPPAGPPPAAAPLQSAPPPAAAPLQPAPPPTVASLLGLAVDEAEVQERLRTVLDPELGVNIVDLGLVYGVSVSDGMATVLMTTTTPACPIGSYLTDQIRWALLEAGDLLDVEVQVTYEPLWSLERMSDAAKIELGWLR